MTRDEARIDEIVQNLLEKRLPKGERIALLRELVRHERSAPDHILNEALSRLLMRTD